MDSFEYINPINMHYTHLKTILIVAGMELGFQSALKRQDLGVIFCANTQEAIRIMDERKVDLIFLCLMKPLKNGLAVLEMKSQTKNAETPVFAIASREQDEESDAIKNYEIWQFSIMQDTSPKEIIRKIKDYLA
jgi:DNA-binding response OmpR family regulator